MRDLKTIRTQSQQKLRVEGQMSIEQENKADIDLENRKIYLSQTVRVDMPQAKLDELARKEGLGEEALNALSRAMSLEYYLDHDVAYINMGGQWAKTTNPDISKSIWQFIDRIRSVSGYQDLKEQGLEGTLIGEETADNHSCFVISYNVVDFNKLIEFTNKSLGNQATQGVLEGLKAIEKVDFFSGKEWIAKDTYYPVMRYMIGSFFIKRKNKEGKEETMRMTMETTTHTFDHNKPLAINIPSEALNAKEIDKDLQSRLGKDKEETATPSSAQLPTKQ
jgi:hypothetical protein